jgi:hypothetical protein
LSVVRARRAVLAAGCRGTVRILAKSPVFATGLVKPIFFMHDF